MSKKALKTVEPVALPAHLSRRQLLAGTSGGILALTGLGVSLIGCGGGGGGSRSSGGGSISLASGSGSVTLPAGIQASALKAGCGITDSPITAGKFSIKAPGDAPSLITVYNPTNRKAVLFGMYDPSASASSMVDATSTAVALLFMSLGGANYTRDGIKPLLEAINTSAAVAPLASTISSQMATDPYALANGNSAISSALSSAATSLASLIVLPKAVMQPKDAPDLQLINPSDAVDGLTMAALDAGTGFKVINQWRRFMKAYVYTSKHWDTENVERDVSPPSYTAGPLNVSPASSLLNVSGGWAPSYSSDVSLPVQPKDNKTEYKIVSLQPVYGAIEPAFFSDQQWTNEVIRWRQDLSELGGSTFVAFFANVLFSAIGLGALTWTLGELTAAYSSLTALPSFAQVLSIASARSVALGTTARSALNLFVTNDTVGAGVLKALAPLLKEATAVQDAILAGGASEAAIFARMAACLGVVLAGGALALAADIGAVIKDTSTGQEADMWTATVLHQTMRLTPQSPKVGPGEVVTFSVRIPTGTTGTIVFDWFQDSAYAALRSSSGVTGTTLTHIRDLVVDLATTGSDSKPVHMRVVAYDISSGTAVQIGEAGTTVTFFPPAQITPYAPTLAQGATKQFTVTVGGSQPPDAKYVWTVTGSGTVGGASTQTTTTPSVTFVAPKTSETDTLTVEVRNQRNDVLARTETPITVGAAVTFPSSTPTVAKAGNQYQISVNVGGGIPTGGKLRWTLTPGGKDLVNSSIFSGTPGSDTAVDTTTPTITYWAGSGVDPSQAEVDLIRVDVLNSEGASIANATTNIQITQPGGWQLVADSGSTCCGGGIAPGTYSSATMPSLNYTKKDGVLSGYIPQGYLRALVAADSDFEGGSFTMPGSILSDLAVGNFRFVSPATDNIGSLTVTKKTGLPGGHFIAHVDVSEGSGSAAFTQTYKGSGYIVILKS